MILYFKVDSLCSYSIFTLSGIFVIFGLLFHSRSFILSLNIAINGCGRIGRCLIRLIAHSKDIHLVAINDIAPIHSIAYALKFDSIHQQKHLDIDIHNNTLIINGVSTQYTQEKNNQDIDFGKVGAEIVIESSGRFLTQESTKHHLKKGVKKVILSAPAQDHTPTFVMGVNHHLYQGESIISNASCTTNCLAPIAFLLDKKYGIQKGIITTIHSYTNDQKILDGIHATDLRRSRSAAINIIPTTTGAAKALCLVLPQLKNKLHGHSVRVPTPNVSMLDLNVVLQQDVTTDKVRAMFKHEAQTTLKGILKIDSSYGVSSDFYNDTHSCIIADDLIFVIDSNMLKIMAWYDNEWGYANRLLEMAQFISS